LFGFAPAVAAVVAQVALHSQVVGTDALEASFAAGVLGARGGASSDTGPIPKIPFLH
jgi:hypothetical protein